LLDVADPFAGSYCMESLTDTIEKEAWEELNKIDEMGGAVEAIKNGYMQRQVAKSAYEHQKKVNDGELLIVGVNCFTGENELEVQTTRLVPHPYDPEKRLRAEEHQIASIKEVKRTRDNAKVARLLQKLEKKTKNEEENLVPHLIDCAKAYISLQEVCDVFRDIFGEYEPPSIM
jgi:methylmalonyl-CoA mutase, N-terminal domain